jgi:uncharacterized protein YjlB
MRMSKIYAIAMLLAANSAPLAAQEMVGPYKLVPALPRPGATEIFDNDRGRVWDVIYPPGMSTGMHRHASDFLGIELIETMLKVTTPDGKEHISPVHRGNIYMLPKGLTHIEENVIGHAQRNSILIELKDASPRAYKNNGNAAEGFAADGAKKMADNNRVILWDVNFAKDAQTKPFFQNRDMFLVPEEPGTLDIGGDEAVKTLPVANGQVVFLPGGHTRTIEAKGNAIRVGVAELK